jgi:hypothetical protein
MPQPTKQICRRLAIGEACGEWLLICGLRPLTSSSSELHLSNHDMSGILDGSIHVRSPQSFPVMEDFFRDKLPVSQVELHFV